MPESYYFDFFNYAILDQKTIKEKFNLGPAELTVTNEVEFQNEQIYIDIDFKRWEHLDFTPQCIVRIYNRGKISKELVYELKTQREECQFHIPIPLDYCSNDPCILKVVLRNKESHSYIISDLNVKVYGKQMTPAEAGSSLRFDIDR